MIDIDNLGNDENKEIFSNKKENITGKKKTRPFESITGEPRDKKINITFTQSELWKIEDFMKNNNHVLKTKFLREVIMNYIEKNTK